MYKATQIGFPIGLILFLGLNSCQLSEGSENLGEEILCTTWEETTPDETLDTAFIPIESWHPFKSLNPSYNVTYWELGMMHYYEKDSILDFGGSKCCGVKDTKFCQFFFSNYPEWGGLGPNCPPFNCNMNILYHTENEYVIINDPTEAIYFLGEIDTGSEALFVARLRGYGLINSPNFGTIKKVHNGYEIRARNIISTCRPWIAKQYLIFIKYDASLEVLEEEIYEYNEDECIYS